jgi:hypothetical protein
MKDPVTGEVDADLVEESTGNGDLDQASGVREYSYTMSGEQDKPIDKLLLSLQERAKELNCLYEVEQPLNGGKRDRQPVTSR